jgi:MFS family permease
MFCFQNDQKISLALLDYNANISLINDEEYTNVTLAKNESLKIEKKIDHFVDIVWTVINCLFVIGGMIGSLSSKYVLDFFGRKRSILFKHSFTVIGSILVIIAPHVRSPVCIAVSRFFFGIQGGLTSSLM